mgnify:CR=1 FL=1
MESRCCLMHRLKKAVRASLVLLSLLFYVFGLHVHYVNRTVTAIGALKDSEPEVQPVSYTHLTLPTNSLV